MWGWLFFIFDLVIRGIIFLAKIIWKILTICFAFIIDAIVDMRDLNWKNENDRSKIVKNIIIIIISVVVIIFVIIAVSPIFNGGGKTNKHSNAATTKQNTSIEQTINNSASTEISGNQLITGWANDANSPNEIIYYDKNSKLVVNKDYEIDGSMYHFDENGFVLRDKWHNDRYFGTDGKMVKNEWVGDYYVGNDGKYIKDKVKDETVIAESNVKETEIKIVETTIPKINVEKETTTAASVVINTNINDNFYIDGKLDTYAETFEIEDDYSSKATIVIPKIAGKDINLVNRANEFLNAAKDDFIDEAENILSEESPAYKLLSINNSEISSQSATRLRISLSGTLKTNSGTTKKIKYMFTYDIENDDYELERK